jgi:hypothetical protein
VQQGSLARHYDKDFLLEDVPMPARGTTPGATVWIVRPIDYEPTLRPITAIRALMLPPNS